MKDRTLVLALMLFLLPILWAAGGGEFVGALFLTGGAALGLGALLLVPVVIVLSPIIIIVLLIKIASKV